MTWGLLLALLLLASPLRSQASDGEEVAQLLRQAGIQPVEPASPALDFELVDLDRRPRSLSGNGEEWLVLTFFATWCGPCRAEMPTLERLYRELEGGGQPSQTGVRVVAVSVDQQLEVVRPFASGLGLSFPVLWDERGDAASSYRASSIPVSYVIDPAGRIAGVSRGARDWSKLAGLFRALVASTPAGSRGQRAWLASGQAAGEPVSLPTRLVPPSATVALSEPEPIVGRPFALEVRIRWAGDFQDYLLQPPKLPLPDGVVQTGTSAETSGQGGRKVVTYRIALRAERAGSFALDPVELHYTPALESEPVTSRIAGPTVTVRERQLLGVDSSALALGVAVPALAALGGLGLWLARRRRRGDPPGPAEDASRWSTALEAARRVRIEGEQGDALSRLLALDAEVPGEALAGVERTELEARLEGCRFGREAVPREHLERLERSLERRIAAHLGGAEERRQAIRLKEPAQQNLADGNDDYHFVR